MTQLMHLTLGPMIRCSASTIRGCANRSAMKRGDLVRVVDAQDACDRFLVRSVRRKWFQPRDVAALAAADGSDLGP